MTHPATSKAINTLTNDQAYLDRLNMMNAYPYQEHGEGYTVTADYQQGFADGVASVRSRPYIVVNWSTLIGGIINAVTFAGFLFAAMWIGEMRGMKSDNRMTITFSEDSGAPK